MTQTSKFLGDFLVRKRMDKTKVSSDVMAQRIMAFHDALMRGKKIETKQCTIIYKSNSLRVRDRSSPAFKDEWTMTTEVSAISAPAHTYGFRITVSDKVFDLGDISPVVTRNEKVVAVTSLPISPNLFEGAVPDNNVLLFFHEPLAPGDTYKIYMTGPLEEVLYDLITPKRNDTVEYYLRNMDEVEEVNLVAYVPSTVPRPDVRELTKPLPTGLERVKSWELTEGQIAHIVGAGPPRDYYSIGWQARGLRRNQGFGFIAYAG